MDLVAGSRCHVCGSRDDREDADQSERLTLPGICPLEPGQIRCHIIIFDKRDEFGELIGHKDAFFPDNTEFARDLRSDRNLREIPWVDGDRRVEKRTAITPAGIQAV